MSAPQTRPSVPARRSGSGTHHAARSRGHRLAARLRAVGAPVGVRAHPRCLLHPHGARRRCRASRRPRAAPRLSRAPLLAQGLPLSSLLSVAARTACGHSEWYLHIRSTPRDPWTSLHCARGSRERDMRDNALFERIGRSRGGSQLTHECIGQQSLLHSTGSDPAPTVAHVLPLDSSEAALASPPRAPNTNHCPRQSTSGRRLRAR